MKVGNPYSYLEDEPHTWLVFGGMGKKQTALIPNSAVEERLSRSGECGVSVRRATDEECLQAETKRRFQ